MNISEKKLMELRECLELLIGSEYFEFHNKNWLPTWALKNPRDFSAEKMLLLNRMQKIIGTSASQIHT
jgi:hypothetical protein